jgi:hypothetical protein
MFVALVVAAKLTDTAYQWPAYAVSSALVGVAFALANRARPGGGDR